MKIKKIIIAIAILLLSCNKEQRQKENKAIEITNPSSYVNPFIGTGFNGHTFPGACLPNGMVQLSPDTRTLGWSACSGYHFDDSTLYGFAHTHMSGTGMGDMSDVMFHPYTGKLAQPAITTISKSSERASPGYYRVFLNKYNINAELTATQRVGVHRYTYPKNADAKLFINPTHILLPVWGHSARVSDIQVVNDTTVVGVQRTQGWAFEHIVAFKAVFNQPIKQFKVYKKGKPTQTNKISGKDIGVRLYFGKLNQPLIAKVGISPVDIAGAEKNLTAEVKDFSFDEVKKSATKTWNKALSSIHIKSSIKDVDTIFYTALYHGLITPYLYQDVDGRYRDMRRNIVVNKNKDRPNYTVFSLWDTFRALHPLLTIIEPKKSSIYAENLMQKYREGGILPKWPFASNYTGTMVGYPAVSVLADAIEKGLYKGDLNEVLEAALISSTYNPQVLEPMEEERGPRMMTKHVYFKEKLGYVPADSIHKSVSYGLEMAYYDWCISKIAAKAGNKKIEEEYIKRAGYYKNYFDNSTGFMRGKMADGSWRTPFEPKYSSHESSDYVEGNAYQWSFLAPHDPQGLVNLHGGKQEFEQSLDSLFMTSSEIKGKQASADITGLIGQYAHGNEPSHHMAYLYTYVGKPRKTQRILDSIMTTFYDATPRGIVGNEDCGQMSAWYIMNALGFYQDCPGNPTYLIGRPMIDEAVINIPNGQFRIVVENNSLKNKHVKEAFLVENGKEKRLDKLSFSHQDIRDGVTLKIVMEK